MSADLPVNREAEIGIIGACLWGMDTAVEAGELVPSKALFHDDTRAIYECICRLASSGVQPDTIAVRNEWKKAFGNREIPTWLYEAQSNHPDFMLRERAAAVLDAFERRRAILTGDQLMKRAADPTQSVTEAICEAELALAPEVSKAPPIIEPKDQAKALVSDLERRFELQGKRSGIETGFHKLDEMTDGLQLSEFWIIGARPNVGKTAIALNIAHHVAFVQRIPSLFVSLEMTSVALNRRLTSMHCKIDGMKIRRGDFNAGDFKKITTFTSALSSAPWHILDSPGGISLGTLLRSVRSAIRKWGIKVVFLDYLQKIRPESKGEKRTYEIGEATSALVDLVKREKINMLALAQLNRESEKEKGRQPRNSDLADSKSIEADADFVGLLHRPIDGDDRRANLIVAKQRDGERGVVPLVFRGEHCQFLPHSPIDEPEPTRNDEPTQPYKD
jgi:replicative DNA helicase